MPLALNSFWESWDRDVIGVFICRCGGNISRTVDLEKAKVEISELEDVSTVEIAEFLCSDLGLQMIRNDIKKLGLKRVVIAACSPHMHEETFRNSIAGAELNRYLLEHVNIREHCSWVHNDIDKATKKAIDLITGGVFRARELEPLEPLEVEVSKKVMIIGGGIAGITAALQLADLNHEVILVERRPSIGGRMAQLSKVFPTLDCAPCILSPLMADTKAAPNIRVSTLSEVEEVAGGPGNFRVKVRIRIRGVDVDKCLKCGGCEKLCPVTVSDEFEEGMYKRKAIYMPFDQAIPSAYVVDFKNCIKCGKCAEFCPVNAVDLEKDDEQMTLKVGAIIVATGFDLLNDKRIMRRYLSHPQCITSLQLERLIENELAAGKVLKTPIGQRIKKIAFILCVGSRDPHLGVEYCSRVCCPYSIKEAVLLKKILPYLDIWIYYTDIRMSGRGFEELYRNAMEMGIKFIRGKPGEVTVDSSGNIELIAEDADTGYLLRNNVDLVIACPALVPSEGTDKLADLLKIPLGADNFISEKHPKVNPVATFRGGIFAAGVALGPKDIHDCVVEARAAASQVAEFIGDGKRVLDPIKPRLISECEECMQCVSICPSKAIFFEQGFYVDKSSCTGCGACVPACEKNALELAHYTKKQLESTIKGILYKSREFPVLLGFLGDQTAYPTADATGISKLQYPHNIRIMRVPSTALISHSLILETLTWGADGVILGEKDGSIEAHLTITQIDAAKVKLSNLGGDERRIIFQPLLLPMSKALSHILSRHTDLMKQLGKISEGTRLKISKAIS
nr:FAD-dependent oxidoreductase [Candidatus Njordarchaeum guaymaensis]